MGANVDDSAPQTRRRTTGSRQGAARRALLDAGLKIFAREGVKGVTLDEIAHKARVSPQVARVQFDSTSDLLLALAQRETQRRIVAMRKAHTDPGIRIAAPRTHEDREQALHQFLNRFIGMQDDTRDWLMVEQEIWLHGVRYPEVGPKLSAFMHERWEELTRILFESITWYGMEFRVHPRTAFGILYSTYTMALRLEVLDRELHGRVPTKLSDPMRELLLETVNMIVACPQDPHPRSQPR